MLQACLALFFSYSQVKMVIARINKDHLLENEWHEMAGFRFLQELGPTQGSLRLHYHTGLGYLDK